LVGERARNTTVPSASWAAVPQRIHTRQSPAPASAQCNAADQLKLRKYRPPINMKNSQAQAQAQAQAQTQFECLTVLQKAIGTHHSPYFSI
jgi:hypothetical protein